MTGVPEPDAARVRTEDRRLFVPLSRQPYEWFTTGQKVWEVRRRRRAFASDKIVVGRRVELRHGYQDRSSSMWGTIVEVRLDNSVAGLLARIPFREVVPGATDYGTAVQAASDILGVDPAESGPIIAIRLEMDPPGPSVTRIMFAPEYEDLVLRGLKTTTIRRRNEQAILGPAVLSFGPGRAIEAVVNAVVYTSATHLTELDAHRDGFASRDELFAALRRHYLGFTPEERIMIVEFTWTT